MADVSNLKINKRSNVDVRLNLRVTKVENENCEN